MKASLIVASVWMLSAAMLQGAEHGFDEMVQAISDQLHARPLHIPFFGLVNVAAAVARPAGVKHLDLAVFQNLDVDESAAREIGKAVRQIDGGWRPFIHVRSSQHGHDENVVVYMTADGGDCKLLVMTLEPNEATVVEVRLNPENLEAFLDSNRGLRGLRTGSHSPGD
jgi:hypothetical protein